MKCPQCGNEMVDGYIPGHKFRVKFVPYSFSKLKEDELLKDSVTGGYIPLTKSPLFWSKYFDCFYCSKCKMIVGPVKDIYKK